MCRPVKFLALLALLVTCLAVATCGADGWNDASYNYEQHFQHYSERAGDQAWVIHFIEHPKTYPEAEKYCHDLCYECELLDPLWLRNHSEEIRPYVTGTRSWLGLGSYGRYRIGFCPVLSGLDEELSFEPCASQLGFFCILPKEAQQCQSSLVVRNPADYRNMSLACGAWGGGNTVPLDFLGTQERPCAKLHSALSSQWWTSSGLHHTRWLHAYLGPPKDQCMAAKSALAGGFSVTRMECDSVLPYICLLPMSHDDTTTVTNQVEVRKPERVKCYYFTGDTVGTYCHVLDPDGAVDAAQAQSQCDVLGMDLMSVHLIDQHRLCLLIDIFGIADDGLWIASRPEDISSSLHSDECDLVVGNVTIAKNGSALCSNCSARVLCVGSFYHKSSDRVTISRDSDHQHRVDYRYFDVGKNAFESEGQCMRDSLSLLNVKTLKDPAVQRALYPVIEYRHSEVWLDLSGPDIPSPSAVVAISPSAPARRARRCFSAWFGRIVPWIFERECNKKLAIICVGTHPATPPAAQEDECSYHRVENSNIVYCSPSTEGYISEEGLAYCNARNMSLLDRGILSYIRYFHFGVLELPQDEDNNVIWVKDNNVSSPHCTAAHNFVERTNENCRDIHPYVCTGQLTSTSKLPMSCFKCRLCATPYSFCLSSDYAYGNYNTGSTICSASQHYLLPGSLDYTDYLEMFLSIAIGASEVVEVWLDSGHRTRGDNCRSMYYRDNQVFSRAVSCNAKLQIICVDDRFPAGTTEVSPAATSGEFTTDSTSVTPCHEETVDGYHWPTTRQNEYARAPCAHSAANQDSGSPSVNDLDEKVENGRMAWRRCTSLGEWEPFVNTSGCISKNVVKLLDETKKLNDTREIGEVLIDASKEVSAGGDLLALAEGVFDVLRRLDTLIANLSEDMKRNRTESFAKETVAVAQNVMEKTSAWHGLPRENRLRAATEYMGSIEKSVNTMLKYSADDASFDLSQGDVTVEVRKSNSEAFSEEFSLPAKDTGTSVSLPPNFIRSEGVVSIVYAEYPALGALLNTNQQADNEGGSYQVGTPVVTATVLLDETPQSSISGNVTLRFKKMPGESNNADQKCVFLINGTTAHWNDSGCSVASSSSSEITCICDHLTNFAVLLSAKGDSTSDALEWITDIGCAISIVCLVLCILVFTVYRQLRGIRNTIHRNLCISLLLAEVLLLFAMDRDGKSPALCTFFACLLHFLFLSAFSWMALEGCHIILLLWKVFNPKRDYYERYYLAGYGIPLVIVSITVGVGYDAYQNNPKYCWIPVERNLRLSFIIPVVLVVLLNIGALCLVLWKMSRLKQAADKSTSEKVRNWVRGTIILLPLLGVTWLLGLALWQDTVGVMAYVFTVFNSLQGLGIFVCHVILSKKARELVLKTIYNTGSRLKGPRSTGSTRSGGHKTIWFQLSSSTTNSRASESHSQPQQQTRQQTQLCETESDSSSGQDCWTPRKFKFDFKVTNPLSHGTPAEKVSAMDGVCYRPRGSQC